MAPLYANDIGGMGQMLLADRSYRANQSNLALQQLMQARQQALAQRNFELQNAQAQQAQQFNMQQAREQAARQQAQADTTNAYNERSYREVILPESKNRIESTKQKTQAVEAKDVLKHLESDLTFRVQNRLPYNPQDYAALPDTVKAPLIAYDQAERQKEVATFNQAKEVANAGRSIRMIQQRTAELEKAPWSSWRGSYLGGNEDGQQDPRMIAKAMKERVAPYAARYLPMLDPKAGLVVPDPQTGAYLPHPNIIKPWMDGGRSLKMAVESQTAQAAPKAQNPPEFYDLVNKLIGEGLQPADAKRQAMQQFMR